jgi:hypothetical protein
MEEHTRKFKHIRARTSSEPWQKKSSQPPRRSWTTTAEIEFCVNCEKKSCNGNRCAELKKFLREVKQ